MPTIKDLIKIEPRLSALLQRAEAIKDTGGRSFCANRVFALELKPTLYKLVGWDAETQNKVLNSEAAYNVVYDAVYNKLPDCRNCGCMQIEPHDVSTDNRSSQ